MIPDHEKEQLKTTFNFVAYIGGIAKLSKRIDGWWCCCPLHTEQTPSFHIKQNGKEWYCHGCGQGGDSISFIELYNHLDFNGAVNFMRQNSNTYYAEPIQASEPIKPKKCTHVTQGVDGSTLVETYPYKSNLMKCKYIDNNGKKTFRWYHAIDDSWYYGTGEHKKGLYTARRLLGDVVLLVEGESCCHTLLKMGYSAATSPDGCDPNASKWKPEYSMELANKDVIIICDEDDNGNGQQYADNIAIKLNGIAKSVHRLNPSEIAPKEKNGWDIKDVVEKIGIEQTKLFLDSYIEKCLTQPQTDVMIVRDYGLGEELNILIEQAAQEVANTGEVSLSTEAELNMARGRKVKVSSVERQIKKRVTEIKTARGIMTPKQVSEPISIDEYGNFEIGATGYIRTNDGKIVDERTNEVILNQTALCVARMKNIEKGTISMMLAFDDYDGTTKMIEVPLKMLNSTIEMFKICSDCGLDITQPNAASVVSYFYAQREANKDIIREINVMHRLGWYKDKLLPLEAKDIDVLVRDPQGKETEKLFKATGDKQLQLQAITDLLNISDTSKIILGATVASLMIGYTREEIPPAINIHENTSVGKSIATRIITSVYGATGMRKSYWMRSNATDNADQNYAAYLYNYPIIIDDMIQQRGLKGREQAVKERAIYALVSGEGRGRVKQDGVTAQKVMQWHNVLILTNEDEIIENQSSGGLLSRMIDFSFEEHLSHEFCKKNLDIIERNYGNFNQDIADSVRELGTEQIQALINDKYSILSELGVKDKRGRCLSIIAAGYDVACMALGYNGKFPYEKCVRDISKSGDVSDGARAYNTFMTWLETAIEQFRRHYDTKTGTLIGKLDYHDGKKAVFITKEKYQQICDEKNVPHKQLMAFAYRRNLFVSNYNSKNIIAYHRFKADGHDVRGIIIPYDWTDRESYDYIHKY